MTSINEEIKKMKNVRSSVDALYYDSHTVITGEKDCTTTAYCFSVPVSNKNRPISLCFSNQKGDSVFYGTSSKIIINDKILIQDLYGNIEMHAPWKIFMRMKDKIHMHFDDKSELDSSVIIPTFNGLAMKIPISKIGKFGFNIRLDLTPTIKSNGKYLSFRYIKNNSRLTISCIGTFDSDNKLIAPCEIRCKPVDEKNYKVSILPMDKDGKYVFFEMNIQEPKLFLDTTVESKNPRKGNTFGSVAFIGNSKFYGETWLYTKLNFNELKKLEGKRIEQAIMYIPNLSQRKLLLSASPVSAYFCSINSTWENKIAILDSDTELNVNSSYYKFDITEYVKQSSLGLMYANGFAIKAKSRVNGFVAISTGDSYYAPQILEIKYK